MFLKSYNAYYPDKNIELNDPKGSGYDSPLEETDDVPRGTYLNPSTESLDINYWLASPSSSGASYVRLVKGESNKVYTSYYNHTGELIRPIVCLNSTVEIVWDSISSQYILD